MSRDPGLTATLGGGVWGTGQPPITLPCQEAGSGWEVSWLAASDSGAHSGRQVHAYIISYLKKEMPSVFGKENKKKQLIMKLPVIFAKIQLEHHISPGDFPDCEKMQVGVPEDGVGSTFPTERCQ